MIIKCYKPLVISASFFMMPIGVFAQNIDIESHYTDTLVTNEDMISTGGMGGVTIDGVGYLYMSNFDDHVWRIEPSTGQVEEWARGFMAASGNTALANGDLLQADFRANRIYRIDRDRNKTLFSASELLQGPVALTEGADGSIYVANCIGGNILKISADGETAEVFATDEGFNCPNGITGDGDGNLYVVNNPDTYVFKLTANGEAEVFALLPGVGNGHITYTMGALYVSQLWNHKIVKLNLDGTYETIAGTGRPGLKDGWTGTSEVTHPNGITSRGSLLYHNSISGPMMGGLGGATLVIRKTELPVFFRVVRQAYAQGGLVSMLSAYEQFAATMEAEAISNNVQNVGYALFQAGQYEAGLELHEKDAADHPDSIVALQGLGDAHAFYGDVARAKEIYERALALDPENVGLQKRLEGLE